MLKFQSGILIAPRCTFLFFKTFIQINFSRDKIQVFINIHDYNIIIDIDINIVLLLLLFLTL